MLLAYGDHQPSLPALFGALEYADTVTDYVMWEAGSAVGARAPRQMAVEALPQLLLDRVGDAPRMVREAAD
jgi:hypothetical protein